MDNSTCELIDNIINEWATETFDLTIVVRYRDNAYSLSPNNIQIYFSNFVVIGSTKVFECYDRFGMRKMKDIPDNINPQSIGKNIRELHGAMYDTQLFVGCLYNFQIFEMLDQITLTN